MTFCEAFTKALKESKGLKRAEQNVQYRVIFWGGYPEILFYYPNCMDSLGRIDSFDVADILADDWEVVE